RKAPGLLRRVCVVSLESSLRRNERAQRYKSSFRLVTSNVRKSLRALRIFASFADLYGFAQNQNLKILNIGSRKAAKIRKAHKQDFRAISKVLLLLGLVPGFFTETRARNNPRNTAETSYRIV